MGTSSSPSSSDGFVPDLATCRLMSIDEKRELIRGLSKSHCSAPGQLQEWSRREIIEVLCAELGRERKERTFSSKPKHKLLDILFKVVNGESFRTWEYKKRKSISDLKTIDEKRELICGLSFCQNSAPGQLQEWSRSEILEVLCAVLGKERKERTFSSIPKHKLLDFLLKVVNGESFHPHKHKKRKSVRELNANNLPSPSKRWQKNDSSASLPVMAGTGTDISALANNAHLCQNLACRATLSPKDKFCKSCSCCICFKYDEDKDPTLWLFCNSDQPLQEDSCGFSCHLECALDDERSGILKSEQLKKLDGDYYCTQCGKQNNLLGCWKKQLWIAKDARRLDVLCHRIFLSHKILKSTKRYLVLHEIVEKAMKKLEDELGPITGILDTGRGLVCRLAVRAEVQKLCICALKSLQSLFSGSLTAGFQIQRSSITCCSEPKQTIKHGDIEESGFGGLEKFPRATATVSDDDEEEITGSDAHAALSRKSSSLTVYNQGTLKQNLEMIFAGSEATNLAETGNRLVEPHEYSDSLLHIQATGSVKCKVVAEKSFKDVKSGDHVSQNVCTKAEISQENFSGTTISGEFDDERGKDGPSEPDATTPTLLHRESSDLIFKNGGTLQSLSAGTAKLENASETRTEHENEITLGNEITATGFKSKSDYRINRSFPPKPETEPGSSYDRSLSGKCDETSRKECSAHAEASYEHCIKVVRRLECEGHICADFRLNFLTWFCLRTTPHERRTFGLFVDTLIDDLASLARQLRDTFSDAIYRKGVPRGPFLFGVELKP